MTRWLGNILEILWNIGHRPLTKSCFQSVMFSRQYARYPPDHISCSTAVLGCVGCTQGTCCELFFKDAQTPWRICFTSLFACEEWLVCFVCLWRCGFLLGCIAKPKPAQEILWITNITLRPWLGFPPEKWQKNVYCSIHLDVGFFLFSFIPCKVRNQRWATSSISGTSQNRQLTVGWLDAFAPFAAVFFCSSLFEGCGAFHFLWCRRPGFLNGKSFVDSDSGPFFPWQKKHHGKPPCFCHGRQGQTWWHGFRPCKQRLTGPNHLSWMFFGRPRMRSPRHDQDMLPIFRGLGIPKRIKPYICDEPSQHPGTRGGLTEALPFL